MVADVIWGRAAKRSNNLCNNGCNHHHNDEVKNSIANSNRFKHDYN